MLADLGECAKKWDFALNWMLLGSRDNSMIESFDYSFLEDG